MSKYIDAGRLKAKLDELYRNYQSKYMETRTPYTQGLIDALDLAEQVIDSLQQEQPEINFEKELKNERLILLDSFGPMNGEQSLAIKNFARHFYELGKNSK